MATAASRYGEEPPAPSLSATSGYATIRSALSAQFSSTNLRDRSNAAAPTAALRCGAETPSEKRRHGVQHARVARHTVRVACNGRALPITNRHCNAADAQPSLQPAPHAPTHATALNMTWLRRARAIVPARCALQASAARVGASRQERTRRTG
jgi:hypothetical protein